MKKKFFKYVMSPIDWFYGCMTLEEYFEARVSLRSAYGVEAVVSLTMSSLLVEMQSIREWEGDISEGIYVFAIPNESMCNIGFIWKQSNNGTTFIISEVELPWLSESLV